MRTAAQLDPPARRMLRTGSDPAVGLLTQVTPKLVASCVQRSGAMTSKKSNEKKKAKQLRTLSTQDLSHVSGGDYIPGVRGSGSSTSGGGGTCDT